MDSINTHFIRLKAAPLYTGIAALSIALVWSLAIYKVAEDKAQAIAGIRNNLQNVVIGLKEHSQDSFNVADEALRMLKFHYEANDTRDLRLINRYFQKKTVDISALNQVGIIDANGIYIYSSLTNHNRIDLSDREHFKIHKANYPYPLFVSKPVIGRATGKWSFQITRRLDDHHGQFKGVAVASLNPTNFLDRYSRIQLGPDSLIGLVGLDGYARTMRVGDSIRAEDNLRNLMLPKNLGESTSGHFFSKEFFDHIPRIFVFEQLNGMPLFAIAGVPEAVAFQNFYRQKTITIVTAWMLSLLIVLVAWHTLRNTRARELLLTELSDRQSMLQHLNSRQRAQTQYMAELEHMATLGKTAQNTAQQCQTTVEAIQASLADIEKQRNTYETLTQVYFRFKMKQITAEEFMVIIRKIKPEQVLDELSGKLHQTKALVRQIANALGSLIHSTKQVKQTAQCHPDWQEPRGPVCSDAAKPPSTVRSEWV